MALLLWHFSYTLVIELSRRVAQIQGSVRTVRELSHADLQAFLSPLLQLFWPKLKADQNAVRQGRLESIHELSDPLLHVFDVHSLSPIDFTELTMNANRGSALGLKRITTCNSHLVGETRGKSIANGCPVKIERHSRLGFVGI